MSVNRLPITKPGLYRILRTSDLASTHGCRRGPMGQVHREETLERGRLHFLSFSSVKAGTDQFRNPVDPAAWASHDGKDSENMAAIVHLPGVYAGHDRITSASPGINAPQYAGPWGRAQVSFKVETTATPGQ